MSLKTRMLDPGLELNPRQRLTQNVVQQTKHFVQRKNITQSALRTHAQSCKMSVSNMWRAASRLSSINDEMGNQYL